MLLDALGNPIEIGHKVVAATKSYGGANLRFGIAEKFNPETGKLTIRMDQQFSKWNPRYATVVNVTDGRKNSNLLNLFNYNLAANATIL